MCICFDWTNIAELLLLPRTFISSYLAAVPVLMLNGRYDFSYSVETNQVPMFQLLGSPEKDKRHVLSDHGHFVAPQQEIKETLDWFDRYLGPVGK